MSQQDQEQPRRIFIRGPGHKVKVHLPSNYNPEQRKNLASLIRHHGGELESHFAKSDIIIFDITQPKSSHALLKQARKLTQPLPVVTPLWLTASVEKGKMQSFEDGEFNPIAELERIGATTDRKKIATKPGGTLSGRNPYNSTDRELIVSTLARASSNLNGLAIAQELERLNPRHTASSYQSYIRDNLHAGARLQLGIDKYRKDHHAQLQLESELRQRQREEDMVRGVPVDSKASVERRKRQAEEEVGEEESQPEGGWKRPRTVKKEPGPAPSLQEVAREPSVSTESSPEDELPLRVPRPAPAQASPLPTLSRAPEPAVESRFVAQDQPREEEVHEASSEVDQLEENEPEGGWGEPAAKTGKPGVHNHRSEELGGSSPTQDHGQGSGQEQEQAHAAASEERASTQGMQKREKFSEGDREMLAKALTELIAEQEMYARPASDDAAGQNGNAADEVEAEVQLLRPAQDFYDEMERQCPRHSAQSWRSHLNKNRLPYTQTAREMWRLQQAGTQESGDEQSEDEDEDEAEEEAEAEAVLGGEKADKPAEEQGSGEIRADTAKTAEIAAPVHRSSHADDEAADQTGDGAHPSQDSDAPDVTVPAAVPEPSIKAQPRQEPEVVIELTRATARAASPVPAVEPHMEDISAVDEVDVISRQSAQDADPFPNEPAFATRLAERAKDAQPEPAAVAPVAPRRAYAEAAVGPSQPITQYQEANAAGAPLGDFLQAIRTTEHFGGAHIEPAPRPNILVASTSASDIKTGVSETPGAQQHVMRARGRKTFGGFERPRSNPLAGTPRVEHHRLVPFWEPDGEDEPESSADPNLDARPSSALPPRRKAGRASVAGPVMRAEPSSSTNMIGPPRPFTSPTRRSLPVSRVAVSARPLYATAKSAQKMRRIEDWTSLMSAELATSGLSDVDEAEEITLRGKATKGTTPRGSRPRAGLQELGPLAATPSPVRVRPRPKSTPAGRASEGARSPAQPEKNKGKEKARTPEEIARAKASYQAKVSELCHEYGLSAPAQAVPFLQPVAGDLKLGRARLEAYVRKLAEENGVERDLIVDFLREAGGVWAEAKRYVALIKRQRERRGG